MVVVHGGGKIITEWLTKQGAATKFVRGERVTDKIGLEVVTAVLAGLVNKDLVAAINDLGGKAIGISGVDGSLLKGKIKNLELGYVGEIVGNKYGYFADSGKGRLCPGNLADQFKSDTLRRRETPLLLNVNADTVAGEIAAALGAEKLIFLTDIAGICDQSGKVIDQLTIGEAEALIASGTASGGMIPKIRASIRALARRKGRADYRWPPDPCFAQGDGEK